MQVYLNILMFATLSLYMCSLFTAQHSVSYIIKGEREKEEEEKKKRRPLHMCVLIISVQAFKC